MDAPRLGLAKKDLLRFLFAAHLSAMFSQRQKPPLFELSQKRSLRAPRLHGLSERIRPFLHNEILRRKPFLLIRRVRRARPAGRRDERIRAEAQHFFFFKTTLAFETPKHTRHGVSGEKEERRTRHTRQRKFCTFQTRHWLLQSRRAERGLTWAKRKASPLPLGGGGSSTRIRREAQRLRPALQLLGEKRALFFEAKTLREGLPA